MAGALEFKVEVIELTSPEELTTRLQQLAGSGWIMVPGTSPIAVYQLCRAAGMTSEQAMSGRPVARFNLDESKVHIMRDGKIVDPHDGSLKDPPTD